MNWLDFAIIIILAISVFTGLKNGLIKSALGLAGFIVGIFLAGRYYTDLAQYLTFLPEVASKVIAFIIIFAAIVLIGVIVAAVLKSIATLLLLGWLNRLGGAAFGLLSGGIFIGAILTLWVKFIGFDSTISGSFMTNIILNYFPLVLGLLPDEFKSIHSFFD